jgi:hypothetical protein
MKIPPQHAEHDRAFYPPQITTPLQVGYESVTFYLLSYPDLAASTPRIGPSRHRPAEIR